MKNEKRLSDDMNVYDRNLIYSGFWNRFIAFVVDQIILGFIRGFFFISTGDLFNINNLLFKESKREYFVSISLYQEYDDPSALFLSMIALFFLSVSFNALIGWLYYAFFESSDKMATPGKMAFSIKVTDNLGEKISFARASGRYFGKYLSGLILFAGFIMAAFTEKKQALHDVLANCLILNKYVDYKEIISPPPAKTGHWDDFVI